MSHFIQTVPMRPLRRWSLAKDRRPPSTSFLHRVAVRPTRFRLVYGANPWEDGSALARITGAAMRRAFYVGRVNEVDAASALVALWEIPSGRAMISWLEIDERLEGHPVVGDQLLLWTWVELPGNGIVENRRHGQIRRRELSDTDREALRGLIAEMEQDSTISRGGR